MPDASSSIPLQWLHVGPGAIYDSLADAPCAEMDDAELLARLNSILGTNFSLDVPGLRDCLQHVRRNARDFGTAYGTLRPWWSYDFLEIPPLMEQRKVELEELRSHALRGPCIVDPTIPVRRIWDLFSNRVLPFHTLPREASYAADDVPSSIWCVSHSWVDEKDRRTVWTTINGEEWPVPLPSATTLAHVRIELLNMGAQYVWLDILCLRQQGGNAPEAEASRTEEWRLDVPTIGNIFQRQNAPCITYFNGLGLPAEFSPAILGSPRHWCNRVWTVQEGCNAWLPGGIDPGRPLGRGFFEHLSNRGDMILAEMTYLEVATFMKGRHCTSELDRIAGLAYLLKCETLPVYDERTPAEAVWLVLIKHLPDEVRTHIFFQFAPVTPFALWPSWSRFLAGQPELLHPPHDLSDGMHKLLYPELFGAMIEASRREQRTVHLADKSQLYSDDIQAQYCNRGYSLGPCRVTQPTRSVPGRARQDVYLEFLGADEPVPLEFHAMHGLLLPGIDYTLVGFSFGSHDGFLDWWVAIEIVAEELDGELLTVEAARWAVLVMDGAQAAFVENIKALMHDMRVVYLPGEEALARTRFRREYLRAIRWTASMLGYTFDTEST
ncbi:hypothetical protein PsYK624_168760 [Phanerochaete sordida]|uniref:Heterokaryon incompatibility domain-containing protein n=1 Tax=Phanerochaete sordida TaxID=48140 RepID=A0A9P3GSA4_9APHY|nr:hypothetical protein PsYK624_168760 [Phanerochaete sordida]